MQEVFSIDNDFHIADAQDAWYRILLFYTILQIQLVSFELWNEYSTFRKTANYMQTSQIKEMQ